MNDIQRRLYEIMKKVDAFCRNHDIEYYLGGGSALGAVRHGGFLPWDDDFDLYITRDNYNKLLKVHKDLQNIGLAFVDGNIYENYHNSIVRIVDQKSTMLAQHRMIDGTPKGFFVEFFIMDPMPKREEEKLIWQKKQWVYSMLRAVAFQAATLRSIDCVDKDLFVYYMNKYENDPKKTLSELKEELFNIKEEDSDEYMLRWGINYTRYDISMFGTPVYVPFEDTCLPVGKEQIEILRDLYGDDWMIIPDASQQETHDDVLLNTDVPYTEYVKDYDRFLDNNKIENAYLPRKKAIMENFFCSTSLLKKSYEFYDGLINNKLQKSGITAEKLKSFVINRQYDAVKESMKDWYNIQFSQLFASGKQYLSIGDERLYYTLVPILLSGEYSKVNKVFVWKKRKSVLKGKIKDLDEYVECIRSAYISLYYKDWERIKVCLSDAAEKFSMHEEQFDYIYLSLIADVKTNDDKTILEKLLKSTHKLIEKYPENHDINCIIGDIYLKLGDSIMAEKQYISVRKNTRNGMLRMYIDEILENIQH